ncbi:ABC-2 type transport system permease protein [Haloactinopolyspora alba]|uniref:ABC-2 type transport system permease protein n=1 Tax=Haloactinopolyspora alba TaxID=648780 RepID=A0A2P8E8S3_9ACTN|nr:ABC transporter permease subunit [Haloactinopolyspora alba]PSL05861.1 ABC-2 type transport system permease protein [Haloactinopolyspora alba]
MTITATEEQRVPARSAPDRQRTPRASFGRILDAEWTKIRTVRSTTWTLSLLFVVSVGLTGLICWGVAGDLAAGGTDESPGAFATWGLMFGQIAALVLGVIVASAEYSSGMIRTTLAASPRRWSVLLAKAFALGGLLLVLGTATSVASFLTGNFFLGQEGVGLALDDPGVLRTLFGGGLFLAVLGLFGLGLGMLMRHTAGAVTVGIALIFVLGNLVGLVPGALGEWLTKLMPGNAGGSIAVVESFNPDLLDPWVGFAVFSGETALLLLVAGVLFSRRDA